MNYNQEPETINLENSVTVHRDVSQRLEKFAYVDKETFKETLGKPPRFFRASTAMKWTLLLFHLLLALNLRRLGSRKRGSLAAWFLMQVGVHAGYHRYFTHRSFRTHPWFEFVLGCAGCLAFQNGPLWWASKHRHHHRHTDTGEDLHSPTKGFWHSHLGWFWSQEAEDVEEINLKLIPDLLRPIPMWIESHQAWLNCFYVSATLLIGGWRGLLSWCVLPVVLCWHTTFATNSVCHTLGSHPQSCYPRDSCLARNNFLIAIANLGEGWHNNHHANPSLSHHGFHRWYQLDVIFVILLILEKLGIVWKLKRKNGASRTQLAALVKDRQRILVDD